MGEDFVMDVKPGTLQHLLYEALIEATEPHTAPELALMIGHGLSETRQLLTTDLIRRKGLPIQKGKRVDGLTEYWLDKDHDRPTLTPRLEVTRLDRRNFPDVFPMIDVIWNDIQNEFAGPFTTQEFKEVIERRAPQIWAIMTAKWGPGGKGSGNLYSPANPLYNYLDKKASAGDLIKHGLVPSRPGWGASQVMQFELAGEKSPPPSEEDVSFIEGKKKLRVHLVRERGAGLRSKLLASRRRSLLACEMCDNTGVSFPMEIRSSIFEVHHNSEPFATGEEKETKLSDLALLCASCHRALHKLVSLRGTWITVADARSQLGL